MSSSLLLGSIELLNLGSVQLLRDFDFGAPAVESHSVARLLFDGDIVSGERAGNRTISLPLRVVAATSTARAALIEQIAAAVDASFTLTWTPNGGLPVVFDCYRAQPKIEYDSLRALQGSQHLTLTFQAQPWTRTPGVVSIAPPVTPSIALDAYDSTAGLTVTGATATAVTSPKVSGTNAVKLTYTLVAATGSGTPGDPVVSGYNAFTVARTFAAKDLTLAQSVSMWVQEGVYGAHFDLTLTSAGGSKTWRVTPYILDDGTYRFLTWNLLAAPTSTTGTFSAAAVTGYSWAWQFSNFSTGSGAQSMYVDELSAYQSGSSGALSGASGYVRFDGVQGSARTPVSFTVDAASAVRRLLLSRSPNPPAGFSPILPTPTSHGGMSPDANAISGNYYTTPVYRVGATTVRGTYAIVVRGYHDTNITISATAKVTADTFTQAVSTTTSTATTSATPDLLVIGELTLPPRDVDGMNTAATIDITLSTASGTFRVDQVYLVDMAGEALLIDLPSTDSHRYWFLDAPDAGQHNSKIVAGSASDRSNAVSVTPYLKGPAAFNFDPGSNNLLVVCDKASGVPSITCSYYPRGLYERSV